LFELNNAALLFSLTLLNGRDQSFEYPTYSSSKTKSASM